jgi:MYXO-CTERM domain-containing protein
MKLFFALAMLVVAALVAPAAFPCGAPFGTGINVDPKQDIVVVHKNDLETYVFQPRFCGTATEFGLILPVPSKLASAPALSKATVFKQLDTLSLPEYRTQTVCGMSPPSTGGTRGGSSSSNGGTTVVSSGTVGFMDYSQLKADTVASFTDWLTSNGYPYDSLATSAFTYYVEKGWYFVAFKVSQGTVSSGTAVCKDLGPVKLSFPTTAPVVPTRMATARNRDASGALAYASNFSWRIFGITEGAQQIGFSDGASSRRVLGFSGLLTAANLTDLDSLAAAGDRMDKLTMTFDYGSTQPDIGLTKVTGQDYREVITTTVYAICPDAAAPDTATPDTQPVTPDASNPSDTSAAFDAVPTDAHLVPVKDAELPRDTSRPDTVSAPDTALSGTPDAGAVISSLPDAAVKKDSATQEPQISRKSSGCSMSSNPAGPGLASMLLLALVLGFLRRRR